MSFCASCFPGCAARPGANGYDPFRIGAYGICRRAKVIIALRKCHANSRFGYQQSNENCKVSAIWLTPGLHAANASRLKSVQLQSWRFVLV
jgi:hypothetical protein